MAGVRGWVGLLVLQSGPGCPRDNQHAINTCAICVGHDANPITRILCFNPLRLSNGYDDCGLRTGYCAWSIDLTSPLVNQSDEQLLRTSLCRALFVRARAEEAAAANQLIARHTSPLLFTFSSTHGSLIATTNTYINIYIYSAARTLRTTIFYYP